MLLMQHDPPKTTIHSNEVFLSCIESQKSMPAFREEVKHALDEGVAIIPSSYIHNCSGNDTITCFFTRL